MIIEAGIYHTAIRLLIYEIPPAADCLRKHHIRKNNIHNTQSVILIAAEVEPSEYRSGNHTSVNCQTALPYIEDTDRVCRIQIVPFKDNIIQTGTDDGDRQHHQKEVFKYLFLIPPFLKLTKR